MGTLEYKDCPLSQLSKCELKMASEAKHSDMLWLKIEVDRLTRSIEKTLSELEDDLRGFAECRAEFARLQEELEKRK